MNITWLCMLALVMALGVGRPADSDTRPVAVSVTVLRDGQPFVGVPIIIRAKTVQDEFYGTTADGGTALIQVQVPVEGTCDLQIKAGQPPPGPTESLSAFRARREPLRTMLNEYTFRLKKASVGPQEAAVAVRMEVTTAISTRFVLQRAGQAFRDRKGVSGPTISRSYCIEIDAENVVVHSIKPLEEAAVYVKYGENMGTIRRVSIGPRLEDVDLGVVEVPPEADRICSLNAQVSGRSGVEKWFESFQDGLTLVSTDGSLILTQVTALGEGPCRMLDGSLPRFPPGTYYIAPGLFMARTAQVALIERVVAGEDLSASGIPRVTLVANQETATTIDLAQAEAAILAGYQNGE